MNTHILVVEDEFSIQKILEHELEQEGFTVDVEDNGETGLAKGMSENYDVILLDVMLPKKDGFTVCRELREAGITSHIIMLSARDDEFSRVHGLDVGADDYMTKPFSSKEIVAKIKALIRRKQTNLDINPSSKKSIQYKNITINPEKFKASVDDQKLELTMKEYELLTLFIANKGRALTRNIMLDKLWGENYFGETRVVDVHIFKLRDKLKAHNIEIKTVRGVGYMLEDE